MKLLVLDGNSLVNRAYFGIKLLTTKDGRYTNAIFGFQNILLNLLSAHHPDAVAIAWDEKAPTFRHTAYDGYKATRHGMPQELAEQMPVLKQLLTDLGFVQVSKYSLAYSGFSQSSVRTPRVDFGCRNAMFRPSAPLRGALSIRRIPFSSTSASAPATPSSTANAR